MPGKTPTISEILNLLAATPVRIAETVAGLSEAQLHTCPAGDEWSANDILAHLRSCADVWGSCIAAIIAENNVTLKAVNPTTWIAKTNYRDIEFLPSLQAFTAQREALLALLNSLPPDVWEHKATVTRAGKPLARTVFSYAKWLAHHERPHIKQIQRIADATRP